MHYFFVEGQTLAEGAEVELAPADVNHAFRVLRLRPGEILAIADGKGQARRAGVVSATTDTVLVRLGAALPSNEPTLRITLYQALAKGEKMDLVTRQAVELGICRFSPITCARSVPRRDQKQERNRERRCRGVIRAAAAQCRRSYLPPVDPVQPLEAVLGELAGTSSFVLHEEERGTPFSSLFGRPCPSSRTVSIFIGPEGGFATVEIEALKEAGAQPAHLGGRILRVDTAAAAAIAILQAAWGDLAPGGD